MVEGLSYHIMPVVFSSHYICHSSKVYKVTLNIAVAYIELVFSH